MNGSVEWSQYVSKSVVNKSVVNKSVVNRFSLTEYIVINLRILPHPSEYSNLTLNRRKKLPGSWVLSWRC